MTFDGGGINLRPTPLNPPIQHLNPKWEASAFSAAIYSSRVRKVQVQTLGEYFGSGVNGAQASRKGVITMDTQTN